MSNPHQNLSSNYQVNSNSHNHNHMNQNNHIVYQRGDSSIMNDQLLELKINDEINTDMIICETIPNHPGFFFSEIGSSTNDNFKIMVRKKDNFINITKFLKDYSQQKKFNDWEKTNTAEKLLNEFYSQG